MVDVWKTLLKISRPRFWPYLLGPYVIGAVAAAQVTDVRIDSWLILLGLFFTYPANFIIYGVNDVYDFETDKVNPKKQEYEVLVRPEVGRTILLQVLVWVAAGFLLVELVPGYHVPALWGMLGFYGFGLFYSMPPVRAKIRPLLDSVFNVLYAFPAMVSYGMLAGRFPDWQLFLAATAWCMAMHAYSAVPDIAADSKAGLQTIATWLGARGTLLFCIGCYLAAIALSRSMLGWFSLAAGTVYIVIMAITYVNPSRDRVFQLYKIFPYLNILVGGILWFWIALALA